MKLSYSKTPAVPLEEAKARALAYLQEEKAKGIQFSRPLPASWVARAIWPAHKMRSQGAGFAAAGILKHLVTERKVAWITKRGTWGYIAL
jgi:hypothetical protein